MERTERIARLKAMLRQIADGEDLVETLRPSIGEALESLGDDSSSAIEKVAVRSLEHVARDRSDLDDDEINALEAIVLPQGRPVVFVRDDRYEALGAPWTHLNAPAVRTRIEERLPSIGRIEMPSGRAPYCGTGFIVGDGLMMTNRHVAEIFAQGLGRRGLRYVSGTAEVNFRREEGTPDSGAEGTFEVTDVLMIHPHWDMSLLRVRGLGKRKPLKLSVRSPDELKGRDVIVAGYPARDPRNDLALQDRIFGGVYQVKRVQPGKMRARASTGSFGHEVLALTHDASTLGGNSGSAVLDAETGEVLALHFGGQYLKANYGVPTYELARDGRVVDLGVNFAGSVSSPGEWGRVWDEIEAEESKVATKSSTAARSSGGASVVQSVASVGAPLATMKVTIPLEVTITVGAPVGAPVIAAAGAAAVPGGEEKVPFIAGRIGARRGYQPGFLGEEVPLPTLTKKGEDVVARTEDGGHELRYHHFSVVVQKRRRLALFTAANVDWSDAKRKLADDGKSFTRAALRGFDKASETWKEDGRIPPEHQLPDVFFTKDGGAFDKGHLVRRDDAAWGKDFEDIQKANGDTYHVTNCSPQVSDFNQARDTDNWGDLEKVVERQSKGSRVILFSGPELDPDDPYFDGRDNGGVAVSVQIPRTFWKIVVAPTEGGELRAYGFVLEQSLDAVPTHEGREGFTVPSEWRRHMVPIKDIEKMLRGWAKLEWLKAHDGYESDEGVAMRKKA